MRDGKEPKPPHLNGKALDAVNVFIVLDTQWRVGGMGERYGLDYSRIKPTYKLLGLKFGKVGFYIVQGLEYATIENNNKESKSE